MTDETRESEPRSPILSGWRKAVLWLIGAGALAVVGYRGALGAETTAAVSPTTPPIIGEERSPPAAPAQAAPAPSGTTVPGPASAPPQRSPASEPALQADGAPATRRRSQEPAGAAGPAGRGAAEASGGHVAAAPPLAAITPDGKIVLNLATEAELRRLPGIGKSRARAIVEHRERLGRFRRLEDLLRVKGIGPRRLAALRAKLVLDAPRDPDRP